MIDNKQTEMQISENTKEQIQKALKQGCTIEVQRRKNDIVYLKVKKEIIATEPKI